MTVNGRDPPGGMKLGLDENIGTRGQRLLADAGHDLATVLEQSLGGAGPLEEALGGLR